MHNIYNIKYSYIFKNADDTFIDQIGHQSDIVVEVAVNSRIIGTLITKNKYYKLLKTGHCVKTTYCVKKHTVSYLLTVRIIYFGGFSRRCQ